MPRLVSTGRCFTGTCRTRSRARTQGVYDGNPAGWAESIEAATERQRAGSAPIQARESGCQIASPPRRAIGPVAPCPLDLFQMRLGPLIEGAQRLGQRSPERRQSILDPGWNDRVDRSSDQPIPLQLAQRLRQHLLGHATDPPMQFAVTLGPLGQLMQDQQRPLVADGGQDLLNVNDLARQFLTNHLGCITPQGTYLMK